MIQGLGLSKETEKLKTGGGDLFRNAGTSQERGRRGNANRSRQPVASLRLAAAC